MSGRTRRAVRFGEGVAEQRGSVLESKEPWIGRVAQLVRAPASHAGGHRFESCRAHHVNPLNSSPLQPLAILFPDSFGQTVSKLYQNCIKTPSVWPACIKTLHLLIRLAIELLQRLALHLQLHLRILLEHPSVTLPK
jgi:hypothetical protein